MRLPPRWVRRPLAAGLIVGLVVAAFALPLLVFLAAVASPALPGHWRPLRLLAFALVYLTLECLGLVAAVALWVASGFGWKLRSPRFQRLHYAVIRFLLAEVMAAARVLFKLEVVTDGVSWSPLDDGVPGSTNAMVVLSRHAGPGDSFLLVRTLMNRDHLRRPRIVLKDTLQLDPLIDVYLNRLPNRFISPAGGADAVAGIAELAADLGEQDALLIFPEGGNFTPKRRERAIEKLRRLGLERMAQRAERMQNVLAPRPGGFLAALDAAPEADVVLVAHTGLDHLLTVTDIWRELPMDKQLIMRWWRVPRSEIPDGRDERIDWLFSRWEEIDRWVDEHRPVDLPPRRMAARLSPDAERPGHQG